MTDAELAAFDKFLGHFIHARRLAVGLTQHQLAERSDLSANQIRRLESGLNRISVAVLFKLSEILGFDPAECFPRNRLAIVH